MIRPDKRYIEKYHARDLPPDTFYISEDHELFYSYAGIAYQRCVRDDIPHLFFHDSGDNENGKKHKKSYLQHKANTGAFHRILSSGKYGNFRNF